MQKNWYFSQRFAKTGCEMRVNCGMQIFWNMYRNTTHRIDRCTWTTASRPIILSSRARFPNKVPTYNLHQRVVLSVYCLNNLGSPVSDDCISEKNYNLYTTVSSVNNGNKSVCVNRLLVPPATSLSTHRPPVIGYQAPTHQRRRVQRPIVFLVGAVWSFGHFTAMMGSLKYWLYLIVELIMQFTTVIFVWNIQT